MKSENENLRKVLLDSIRIENPSAASESGGGHLRDEDFINLIKANSLPGNVRDKSEINGVAPEAASVSSGELSVLRSHLVECDFCLADFKDFYAFFAPAETGELIAGKDEIRNAWQKFAPRISEKKQKPKFWSRLFSDERKPSYFGTLGWSLAAVLLLLSGIAFLALLQSRKENNQLAEQINTQKQQIEIEKQTSEDRLKTLELTGQKSELSVQEKTRLEEEKAELQNRIARLQTDIKRANQRRQTSGEISPPQKIDNSLVAVNTPIYDVFPADSAVRGASGEQSPNKLIVPSGVRNIVLILNAAGRADFPAYRAELVNSSGKTVWRVGGLRKDSSGNFTLTLAGAALKRGNYRLRLFGTNGSNSPEPIAEYAIIIEIT